MDIFGNTELFTEEYIATFIVFFAIIFLIIILPLFIITLIGRIKLFKKCGKSGWKAIIPIYSAYVQDVEIAGLHWGFFIVEELIFFGLYSSIIIILVKAMSYYNLAKKCHKEPIASTIFGAIFCRFVDMVYGFSSKIKYYENTKVGNCGFFNKISD